MPDGTYTITYDAGTFPGVSVIGGTALVNADPGDYTNLTITINTCSSADGVNAGIVAPTPPAAPTITVSDSCGKSVLTASNYSGSLLWSTGDTTASITVNLAASYSVTQTVGGCTSDAATANANPQAIPTLSVIETDPTDCGGLGTLDFTFTNVPDGTYTITYDAGTFTGVNVSGGSAVVDADAGAYNNLTITADGCTSAAGNNASLADPNPPPAPTIIVSDSCGASVLTALNYTGSLLWSTGDTTASITVNLAASYSVTQTVGGCTSDAATANANPQAIPTLSVIETDPTECGGQGTLAFTFTNVPDGNYEINYDGGSFTGVSVLAGAAIVNADAGDYTNLTITINTCTSADGVNAGIVAPTPPAAPTITVSDSCGESVLTASNYSGSLLWSTGDTTASITVNIAGSYSVTQTVGGCTSDAATANANPQAIPTLSVIETDPTDCGGLGTLDFTFTNVPDGTYTITYDAGTFTGVNVSGGSAVVDADAGAYNNLTITADGCTSAAGNNASLADPNPPPAPVIAQFDSCGVSVLTASSYTGSLLWSTGDTTQSIFVTNTGTYSVTQTVNGCTGDVASVTANPKPIPTLSVTESDPNICGGQGTLNFTFTGVPNGTYSIDYDSGNFLGVAVTSGTASVFANSGSYSNLTITVNGCTSAQGINATISSPTPPSTPEIIVRNECGESVLTAANYSGALLWSTGESSESITVNTEGTYSLTQTISGCTSDAATVLVSPLLIPELSVTENDPASCGGSGTLEFSFTNVPDGTYSIDYDAGTFSNVNVTNHTAMVDAVAGAYNNLSISVNGCQSAEGINANLTDPNPPPAPTISVQDNCGGSILTASDYSGTLRWSIGATSEVISVTSAGTYSLTQTVDGCTSEVVSAIATPQKSNLKPEIEVVNDCGESTITLNNLESDAWFVWKYNNITDSTQQNSITITEAGEYTVYQRLQNCSSLDSVVLVNPQTVPSPPNGQNQSMCAVDENSMLQASAVSTDPNTVVVWYDNEIGGKLVVSPVLSSIGTITYYAEAVDTISGCISESRTPVELTLQTYPEEILIDTSIVGKPHNNVAVLIFPAEDLQYQWYLNGNEIQNAKNQFYYVFESDRKTGNVFSVQVEFDNGCKTTFKYPYSKSVENSTLDAFVKSGISIADNTFMYYPNPVNNVLNIAIDYSKLDDFAPLTAKIYSVNGTKVLETPLNRNPQSIQTSELPAGVYSVAIFSGLQRLDVHKLILSKNGN